MNEDKNADSTHADRAQRLLANLVEGHLDLAGLAADSGVGMRDLGSWALEPANARAMDGLLRLGEVRAALMITRYRSLAGVVLAKIIHERQDDSDPDNSELVRKACVDLLKVDLDALRLGERAGGGESANAGDASRDSAAPPAPSEHDILRALQAIGEQGL